MVSPNAQEGQASRGSNVLATYGEALSKFCRRTNGIQKKEAAKAATQDPAKKVGKHWHASHSWCWSLLRPHSHRWYSFAYRHVVEALIAVCILNYILETESFFQNCCTPYFNIFEAVISSIFAVEYFLKIYTVHERRVFAEIPREVALRKWVFSSESFIDLLSWLPFFVEIMCGLHPADSEFLLILRCVRIFKLPVVWRCMRLVSRVLYYNYEILGSSLLVCFMMMLGCSTLLFYTRPRAADVPLDPLDNFSSILDCMYLAILMLSGQGEPLGVMPWYTRIVISITALFAIAQFAIPAAMLTWGFEQEAEHNIVKQNHREKKAAERQMSGKYIADSSSSSDESDRQSEWDGYLEQVLGSEFESSGSDSDSSQKKNAKAGDEQSGTTQQLLEFAASGNDQLSTGERRRANAIFNKLDDDQDGSLDVRKVRAITGNDKEAEDLIGQLGAFQKITGDKSVTHREFFVWLGNIKVNNARHGDKVLLRLLNHMEQKLFLTRSAVKAKRASRTTPLTASAVLRAGAGRGASGAAKAPVSGPAQEFLQIADGFGELQRENEDLEKHILRLEKELAQLKMVSV